MTEEQLKELGLSPSQAKAYLLLVLGGKLSPADLMAKTGESRTNAYMVLDRLVELGMAIKDEVGKKLVYRSNSPVGLAKIAERQRERATQAEAKIRDAMPELVKFYHTHRTQPGVRFLQGREGLREVYKDHLKNGGDEVIFRTKADNDYYGDDLINYMVERAARGIQTDMISPYQAGMYHYAKTENVKYKRQVTFVPEEAYSAPVEISVYGTKLAITSFGEEAIATLIESPQIANAMRQIFAMAKRGATEMMKESKTLPELPADKSNLRQKLDELT